ARAAAFRGASSACRDARLRAGCARASLHSRSRCRLDQRIEGQKARNARSSRFAQKWHYAEQRTIEALLESTDVAVQMRHIGEDAIRHPARAAKSGSFDLPPREQGVIQAAEPHPDDEHYRQTEPRGEVGAGLGCVERHEKTADAFHHYDVGKPR